jgi:adenylate cyclase class 1
MDEKEFVRNRRAFLLFNEERKKRAMEISPKSAHVAFNVIPFLLHMNHPDFPGYIPDENNPPGGIHNYQIGEGTIQSLRKSFPEAPSIRDPNPRFYPPRRFLIQSLMLMGSVGSVAQNYKSDFDYWVCVKTKEFSPEDLEKFKTKCSAIEKWADSMGIEIHFFLTDIYKARVNNFGSSDKESAGTSQAKILKEEFYRTVILVAGKFPLWWMFPPEITDDQYKDLVGKLKDAETGQEDYVDLGNPGRVSTGELFGAALWQMNKAMDSPYKSVLKMGLLEGFLDPAGKKDLLCDSLKQTVFNKPKLIGIVDPYLIMLDRLLSFYERKNRPEVVDLLRKCLYIKVGEKLSQKDVRDSNGTYKAKMMGYYVNKWQWDDAILNDLNHYKEWDLEKVTELGNAVHGYMISTYKSLSDKLNALPDARSFISDEDRTILGRKLFTFYSKKPAKIDLIKKVYEDAFWQENLTFNVEGTSGKEIWQAYQGDLRREFTHKMEVKDKLLKKDRDIVNLIIWLAHNGVADKASFFSLIPNSTEVSLKDITSIHRTFLEFFPNRSVSSLPNEFLLKDAFVTKIFIVVNLYTRKWQSGLEAIHLIYMNSWGEVFCEFHPAQAGFKKLLQYVLDPKSLDLRDWTNFYEIYVPKRGSNPQPLFSQVDNYMRQLMQKSKTIA